MPEPWRKRGRVPGILSGHDGQKQRRVDFVDELKEIMEELRELLGTKQYTRLRQHLTEINDADIAAFIESLDEEDLLKVFRILPKSSAADVFSTSR